MVKVCEADVHVTFPFSKVGYIVISVLIASAPVFTAVKDKSGFVSSIVPDKADKPISTPPVFSQT